jgi:hypothetical protein
MADGQRLTPTEFQARACFAEYTAGGFIMRRMFVTTDGHIGLTTPTGGEQGDLVCVFRGSSTPYVLRKRETEDRPASSGISGAEETYELICEAYLHGFMQGEGMSEGCELRWFTLV